MTRVAAAEAALVNCLAIEENARDPIAAEPFGSALPFPPATIQESIQPRGSLRVAKLEWDHYERRVVMDGVPL